MTALALGFADPVRNSQSTFKAIMWALARPGRPMALPTTLEPPAPLSREMAAVALALLDYETAFWLDAPLSAAAEVADFLRFHTGAPRVEDPADARFAFIADPTQLPPLHRFAPGEPDYPDRSTTVVMGMASLSTAPFTLHGPGIKHRVGFGAAPLPTDFAERLTANRALFPLGLDFILTAPGAVAGLPRSTRILPED